MSGIPDQQVPGVFHRRVGDAVVTALNDGFLDLPPEAVRGIAPEELARLLTSAFRRPTPRSAVNAFLVRSGGRVFLIDAGGGNIAGPTLGGLPANLRAAGVGPEAVDAMLMTHLHPDHVGGLLGADGRPAFPNAELLVPEPEAAFWLDEGRTPPAGAEAYFQVARTAARAYGDRLRPFSAGEPVPGIRAEPLPGHTPGHTGYRLASGGEQLLIWGDVLHVPDVQSRRPDVFMRFDADPDTAVATRRRVLDMAAADRLAVAGMHLHFPAFAHVARAVEGYALVPDTWLPVP